MKRDTFFSRFHVLTEWFVRLVFINVIWVVFNIPLLFFIINLFISSNHTELLISITFLLVSIPVSFFPATMAMFALVRLWVVGQGSMKTVRVFWDKYKENYVRRLLGGIISTVLSIILFVDYFYFKVLGYELLKYAFFGMYLFLFMFIMHYFSNNVHFHTSFSQSLKNALFITLKNPFVSIVVTFLNTVLLLISFKLAPFLIFLLMGSVIASVSFLVFYKISLKGLEIY